MMHGQERLDSPIVGMKLTNKPASAGAGPGEVKGKAHPHSPRDESDKTPRGKPKPKGFRRPVRRKCQPTERRPAAGRKKRFKRR